MIDAMILVHDGQCRNSLGERYADALCHAQALVIWIGDLGGTLAHADPAARAFFFIYISGFFQELQPHVRRSAFEAENFGIAYDVNVRMTARFDQLG